ncbi:hypothetical protein BDV23DRAFT_155817 [Aspergillus alliaceus]|uniref:Uncharacterized protein n=1 Tax=Petromyces alliaceus TaxID=209559 RepID=A0A5N7C7F9_PETAA|nr:hypothetical protein BDV23DRAFT_155817 [Aspergillus alliaceus]
MFRRPASIIEIITSVCNQWLSFPLVWVLPAQLYGVPSQHIHNDRLIPSFASCFLLEDRPLLIGSRDAVRRNQGVIHSTGHRCR